VALMLRASRLLVYKRHWWFLFYCHRQGVFSTY
jgi:hypothetical protein